MVKSVHEHRKIISGDHCRNGRMFLRRITIPSREYLYRKLKVSDFSSSDFVFASPTELYITNFKLNLTSHKQWEFQSNKSSFGAVHVITSGQKGNGSFTGIWDASQIYSDPNGIDDIILSTRYNYAILFFVNASLKKTYSTLLTQQSPNILSHIVFTDVGMSIPAKGKVEYTVSFKTAGYIKLEGLSVDEEEFYGTN